MKELEDCHLDHIAVAVNDLDVAQKVYEDLGISFLTEREIVEEQKVETAFGRLDQRAMLELLRPTSDESPIAKFIEKKGTGIHHMCFRVENVQKKSVELKEKGYKLIYETPQKGAHNCLVNFIHPKSTGGVLIEISQKQKD